MIQRPEGAHVIGTMWVDVHKGDRDRPQYRSRFVVQEFRRGAVCDGLEYFAAMALLAALRLMVAFHVTSRVPSVDGGWLDRAPDAVMGFLDAKRAH